MRRVQKAGAPIFSKLSSLRKTNKKKENNEINSKKEEKLLSHDAYSYKEYGSST